MGSDKNVVGRIELTQESMDALFRSHSMITAGVDLNGEFDDPANLIIMTRNVFDQIVEMLSKHYDVSMLSQRFSGDSDGK